MSADTSGTSEELDERITRFPELQLLGQRWDPESGLMQFVDGEEVYARARASVIGSWGRSDSWQWGWANESLPRAARKASLRLRDLAGLTGRSEFLTGDAFPATTVDARRLVADACHYLEAEAACNQSSDLAVWWFALHDVEHVRPLDSLVDRAAQAASDILTQGHSIKLLNALRARFPQATTPPHRARPPRRPRALGA